MMDTLPIELLDIIASHGSDVYYGLLGYKFFTDTLNYGKRIDFMILFGHSVKITEHSIRWYRNGEDHRIDGPSYENIYGAKMWYQHDKQHRENGLPAFVHPNGSKEWYQHGLHHRDNDLPAIEYSDGTKKWYRNGKLHRDTDLPAVQYPNGYKLWYTNGKCIKDIGQRSNKYI